MSKKNYEKRTVSAIENGTVIDHLNPESTFDVIKLLNLKDEFVAIGNNFESSKAGKKGVIKIANKTLTKSELNKIALISPDITASVIKNFQVVEKIKVDIPNHLGSVLKCANPTCITRNEPIETLFYVIEKNPKNVKLKCHHCERIFYRKELELV